MNSPLRTLAQTLAKQAPNLTPAQLTEVMGEIVAWLKANDQLGNWRELEAELHKAWKTQYGLSKLTIRSAHPLSEAAQAQLEKLAHGAEIQASVDERLMGGAVIRVDDKRVDGTVLGALSRLKQVLLS
jgi:F0F1-type ATP synthase delta subunit